VNSTAGGPNERSLKSLETKTMAAPSLKFGTNISHWLSQSTLDRDIMKKVFTQADVKLIADWGMDHIRLPVDYPLIENEGWPGKYSEEGLSWIDRALQWCEASGLWCILDMHVLPGHSFMAEYRTFNTLFAENSPTFRRACDIWRMLAKRYRNQRVVFETLNEPIAPDNKQWNRFAAILHASIRQENSEQWIIVPSNEWDHAVNFKDLSPIGDDTTIYTFHFYEPLLFTHQKAWWIPFMERLGDVSVPYPGPFDHPILNTFSGFPVELDFMKNGPYGTSFFESQLKPILDFVKKTGAMAYCGEFGCITLAPASDRLTWYDDLAHVLVKNGIGFANWDYKSEDFGIVDCNDTVNAGLLKILQDAVL